MLFAPQLEGYRLTTAKILYYLPDHHRTIIQEFVWQDLDIAPRYPVLRRFLDFWKKEIDGQLHSVCVAHARLIKPAEIGHVTDVSQYVH